MQNHAEKVINKSELIEKLASECDNLPEKTVEEASRLLLELMCDTLCHDGRIEVRGFGSFNLHHREPRMARNPKTGEQVRVAAKAIPFFKPGKALREAVDSGDSHS